MNIADLNRRIESLIRLGTIAQVDHGARTLRVQSGGLLTDWLPWPAEIGRNYRRWRPLRVGTQVIIACPSGDPAQALVIGTLYTDVIASPGIDPDIEIDGGQTTTLGGEHSREKFSFALQVTRIDGQTEGQLSVASGID